MGNFLDDLENFLFGKPSQSPQASQADANWDALAKATSQTQSTPLIEGIQPESTTPLVNYPNPSLTDVATAFGIQQRRTRNFIVTDVLAQRLPSSQFLPQNMRPIWDTVGNEGENVKVNGVVKNNWRQVAIQSQGNFLKLEFLPSLRNQNVDTPANSTADFFKEDHSYSANSTSFNQASKPWQTTPGDVQDIEVSRIVLVQFDSLDAPALIARDGEVFKTIFQQVFVTFKAMCPRVRIITGFNSEIICNDVTKIMSAHPAFGPGHGLWDAPSQHCIPWCYSNMGVTIKGIGLSNANTTGTAVAAGTTDTQVIFKNIFKDFPTSGANNAYSGVAIGWVTEWKIWTQTSGVRNYARLSVKSGNGLTSLTLDEGGNQLFGNGSTGGSGSAMILGNYHGMPRRFVLRPDDSLISEFYTDSRDGGEGAYWMTVAGYAYGQIQNDGVTAPLRLQSWLTENPFPLDNNLILK